MRKEIVWVIGIGIVIGLIFAFGIFRINSSINKQAKVEATPTPGTPLSEFKITLSKPENNDVVIDSTTTVSGITKPLAWITVSGESGDYIIQSDDQGTFSQGVDLIAGVNQIKLTAFGPAGAQSTEKVLVVYSSSFQPTTIATPNPDESVTTDSAIRLKVAQKVQEALMRPKAYIGVVTDIADSTIQIKTADSQIEQISVGGDNIAVINSKGTASKTVKLTDIAIGDFIVAMGYVNGNSVLLAQRILITNPITESKIDVFLGSVTATSKKGITVTGLKGAGPVDVTPDKNTDISSFSNGKTASIKLGSIGQGDLVIYVMDSSGTTPATRSIFVVQKSQS